MLVNFRRRYGAAATGVCCLVVASCSSQRYVPIEETGASLSGTVTYKKQKVTGGLITVAGQTPGSSGEIAPDGTYSVNSVPLGEVMIAVNTAPARAKATAMGHAVKGAAPAAVVDVPAKYAIPSKSGVKTSINSGANKFDIVID